MRVRFNGDKEKILEHFLASDEFHERWKIEGRKYIVDLEWRRRKMALRLKDEEKRVVSEEKQENQERKKIVNAEKGWNEEPIGPEYAASIAPHYFNWRKASIYGGSNEIQKNINAKADLGF